MLEDIVINYIKLYTPDTYNIVRIGLPLNYYRQTNKSFPRRQEAREALPRPPRQRESREQVGGNGPDLQ